MRRRFIGSFILFLLVLNVEDRAAQSTLSRILNKISPVALTETEAAQGIRDALSQGVVKAVLNLNKTDGFYGSEFYKILLPPDARRADSTLRKLGLGNQLDKAILAINRGAEDAVVEAKPIFLNAIKSMTVTDAIGIVRGNKDAATVYFQQKTSQQLAEAFTPHIKTSLDKTSATRYYSDLASTYNKIPLTSTKIDPDLTGYVVGKAVDALFDQVAKEEANIRANPAARTTDILKKVFSVKS